MSKHETLNKIPLEDYEEPGCQYTDTKEWNITAFERFLKNSCSVLSSIAGGLYYNLELEVEENGMEKFVAILSAVLFSLQHGEKYNKYFDIAKEDIADFETGEYDDLFTPEDLVLIKKDIAYIKQYLPE